jgi:hypothetical protein
MEAQFQSSIVNFLNSVLRPIAEDVKVRHNELANLPVEQITEQWRLKTGIPAPSGGSLSSISPALLSASIPSGLTPPGGVVTAVSNKKRGGGGGAGSAATKLQRWITIEQFKAEYMDKPICAYCPNRGQEAKKGNVCAAPASFNPTEEKPLLRRCTVCKEKTGVITSKLGEVPTIKADSKVSGFNNPIAPAPSGFSLPSFPGLPTLPSFPTTMGPSGFPFPTTVAPPSNFPISMPGPPNFNSSIPPSGFPAPSGPISISGPPNFNSSIPPSTFPSPSNFPSPSGFPPPGFPMPTTIFSSTTQSASASQPSVSASSFSQMPLAPGPQVQVIRNARQQGIVFPSEEKFRSIAVVEQPNGDLMAIGRVGFQPTTTSDIPADWPNTLTEITSPEDLAFLQANKITYSFRGGQK